MWLPASLRVKEISFLSVLSLLMEFFQRPLHNGKRETSLMKFRFGMRSFVLNVVKCYLICPHAAIRAKVYDKSNLSSAPDGFMHIDPIGKEFVKENEAYTLQVSVEDCTGCNLCVEFCPVESKKEPGHKAINMVDKLALEEKEKKKLGILPWLAWNRSFPCESKHCQRNTVVATTLWILRRLCRMWRNSVSQTALSDVWRKMIIANATGCSSIFGGNLPTTPWTVNEEGGGPALGKFIVRRQCGIRIGNKTGKLIRNVSWRHICWTKWKIKLERISVRPSSIRKKPMRKQFSCKDTRSRHWKDKLKEIGTPEAKNLFELCRLSQWKIHLDCRWWWMGLRYRFQRTWPRPFYRWKCKYPGIGYRSVFQYRRTKNPKHHHSAQARNFLSTENYRKKRSCMAGDCAWKLYVAQIAIGANDAQTVRILREAEAYRDHPSSLPTVIVSRIYDMCMGLTHQQKRSEDRILAIVPLQPIKPKGERFVLDSKEPSLPPSVFLDGETRFTVVKTKDVELALSFMNHASEEIKDRWSRLEMLKECNILFAYVRLFARNYFSQRRRESAFWERTHSSIHFCPANASFSREWGISGSG